MNYQLVPPPQSSLPELHNQSSLLQEIFSKHFFWCILPSLYSALWVIIWQWGSLWGRFSGGRAICYVSFGSFFWWRNKNIKLVRSRRWRNTELVHWSEHHHNRQACRWFCMIKKIPLIINHLYPSSPESPRLQFCLLGRRSWRCLMRSRAAQTPAVKGGDKEVRVNDYSLSEVCSGWKGLCGLKIQ